MPWTTAQIIQCYNEVALSGGQPVATLLEGYDKGVSRYTFTPFSSGVFTSSQEGGKSTGIFFIASGDGSANSGAVIAFSI